MGHNTEHKMCLECGMVATADPFEHLERYAHAPVIRWTDGKDYAFDPHTGGFTQEAGA